MNDGEKRLEEALRVVEDMRSDAQREALADDDAGGGGGMVPPPHDSLRAALRDSSKKVAGGRLADNTPPQHRDALEDFMVIVSALAFERELTDTEHERVRNVRRHLTAPPTVPWVVSRWPDKLRRQAREHTETAERYQTLYPDLARVHRVNAACKTVLADELDRAIAQHSELENGRET